MYNFDTKAAKESDQIGGLLSDTGKYVGKFIRAEKLISTHKGTHGVGFTFQAENGQTARFDIWTMNAENGQLSGYKALMAIMACIKVRSLTIVMADIERTDFDTKEKYVESAEVFKELTDKKIGLLLRSTEYEKMRDGEKTGETGWRLELYAVFEADTGYTAGEIVERKKTPEQLAKIEATLADKPLKKVGNRQQPGSRQQQGERRGGNFADMDDDIPF